MNKIHSFLKYTILVISLVDIPFLIFLKYCFHYVQATEFSMTPKIETHSTDTERETFSKFKSALHKKDNFILLLTVAEVGESMSNPLEISGTTLL